MRAFPIVLALTLVASGCGGAVTTSPNSDGGSSQRASTTTGTYTGLGPSGGYGVQTVTASAPATDTYTSATSAIEVEEQSTGTVPTTITGTDVEVSVSSCEISASNYDQTCTVDSDCVMVTTGNYCGSPNCLCATDAINASASSAFSAAVAQTPVGSGAVRAGDCPCAAVIGPCCRLGLCTTQCAAAPSDTLAPCASGGGTCVYAPGGQCDEPTLPITESPCAYADETRCIP